MFNASRLNYFGRITTIFLLLFAVFVLVVISNRARAAFETLEFNATQPSTEKASPTQEQANFLIHNWNQLMQPGVASRSAFDTFRKYIEASSFIALSRLSKSDLCSRRFVKVDMAGAAWGNHLNEVVAGYWFALLSDRIVVKVRQETQLNPMHFVSEVPLFSDVTELLQRADCAGTKESLVLHLEPSESNYTCADPRTIEQRFVSIHRMQKWVMPRMFSSNQYVKAQMKKWSPELAHLLRHPAFVGIVLGGVMLPCRFVRNEVLRFLSQHGRTDLSVHLRHRDADFDKYAASCVYKSLMKLNKSMNENFPEQSKPSVVLFLANDWNTTFIFKSHLTSMLNSRLRVSIIQVDWQQIVRERPEDAREISMQGATVEQAWGQTGQSGWWGPTPSAVSLVDLYLLSVSKSQIFLGTMTSTFSEIAMGLFLYSTDWNYLDQNESSNRMVLSAGICFNVSPQEFGEVGANRYYKPLDC